MRKRNYLNYSLIGQIKPIRAIIIPTITSGTPIAAPIIVTVKIIPTIRTIIPNNSNESFILKKFI